MAFLQARFPEKEHHRGCLKTPLVAAADKKHSFIRLVAMGQRSGKKELFSFHLKAF
jgi:hypothetical protein